MGVDRSQKPEMPRTSRNSQAAMEAPILPPAATTTPSSPPANAVSKMNGQALTDIATNETEENVFLFVPNLIGEHPTERKEGF